MVLAVRFSSHIYTADVEARMSEEGTRRTGQPLLSHFQRVPYARRAAGAPRCIIARDNSGYNNRIEPPSYAVPRDGLLSALQTRAGMLDPEALAAGNLSSNQESTGERRALAQMQQAEDRLAQTMGELVRIRDELAQRNEEVAHLQQAVRHAVRVARGGGMDFRQFLHAVELAVPTELNDDSSMLVPPSSPHVSAGYDSGGDGDNDDENDGDTSSNDGSSGDSDDSHDSSSDDSDDDGERDSESDSDDDSGDSSSDDSSDDDSGDSGVAMAAQQDLAINEWRTADLRLNDVEFLGSWAAAFEHAERFNRAVVTVGDMVGRGGQGGVYPLESADPELQRRVMEFTGDRGVVVKTAGKDASEDEDKGMLMEIGNLASLREHHMCLVEVYNMSILTATVVMEAMDMSLHGLLGGEENRLSHLSDNVLVKLARDASRGLAHLHKNGLVHGDVKPANMMVNFLTGGKALLKIVDLGHAGMSGMALTGTSWSTSSPEVLHIFALDDEADIRERPRLHPSQDTYSLGLIIQMLLSRSNVPTTDASVLQQHGVVPRGLEDEYAHLRQRADSQNVMGAPDAQLLDARLDREYSVGSGMVVKTQDPGQFILARHVWGEQDTLEYADELVTVLRNVLHVDPLVRMKLADLVEVMTPTSPLFDRKGPGCRPLPQHVKETVNALREQQVNHTDSTPEWLAKVGRWWERCSFTHLIQ